MGNIVYRLNGDLPTVYYKYPMQAVDAMIKATYGNPAGNGRYKFYLTAIALATDVAPCIEWDMIEFQISDVGISTSITLECNGYIDTGFSGYDTMRTELHENYLTGAPDGIELSISPLIIHNLAVNKIEKYIKGFMDKHSKFI